MSQKLQPENVTRVLDGSRRMTSLQIATRIGATPSGTHYLLKAMLLDGTVRRVREHLAAEKGARTVFVYFTSDPQPVAKPYRDLHLTETLTGYGASLGRHMALCLSVRRAA